MPEFAALAFDSSAYSRRTFCSWADAGWRSMLVQVYDDDPVVEHVELPPSGDQHLVLMLGGPSTIESGIDGRWRHATYVRGDLGMTAPGRPTLVRWRATSDEPISTLHAYIPHETLRRIADELWHGAYPQADALSITDALLEQTLLGLLDAARAGAPDLYAETAAEYLAAHVLLRHGNTPAPALPAGSDERAARALQFMRDNLHLPLTLGQIAAEAGLSPFHFLRVFKAATGHTPLRHLTELRIAAARRHLDRSQTPISDIAYLCGFATPAHFTATFTRHVGTSPTAYRRQRRS
ncbi:helix-turn-helix domain-containing protein [Pseudonocardia sp. TRM90224]|uniref:helix-turn-helix domain-containing protein n=1 Tax=Pseudonocardia sp. TRM90224 TaxID=2812678 RepID=UPI001E3BE613|nr:AraC family transcriptional regulator [Pseudonocardia sp. TRM90224]